MTAAELRRAAIKESERRARIRQANGSGFTVVTLAGDHALQLGYMQERSPWIHVMCARQSGKTWGADGILLANALAVPNSTNLLLHLTGVAVRTSNWEPIWLPLCSKYGVPDGAHLRDRMVTRFPNGSRVMFGGTDDLTHVKTYLGNSLPGGVVIIDESQDQRDSTLRYILRQLLPPMLTDTTRVIMSGVLPDTPVGMFLELAKRDEPTQTGGSGSGWAHHEWGRAANIHSPGKLEAYLREQNIPIDDPQIQRDWFMRRVWDLGATAYRYDRTKAGYNGVYPDWLDSFSVGIDPGTRDRTAVQVWGWGRKDRNVYHVHEWVTPRNSGTTWSEIGAELGRIQRRWRPSRWFYDAGGSQMTLDVFQREHGIPVIKAANKQDLPGQVARMADLMNQGRAKVRIGSALEEDLQRAQWDRDARAKGLYRWSSAWHPDAADAARYGLGGYFETYQAPLAIPGPDDAAAANRRAKLTAPDLFDGQRPDLAGRGFGASPFGDFGPTE